jgi:formylglycine-generating enzyme required for sulfatase activity
MPSGASADKNDSAWGLACTRNEDGLHAYPYGQTYDRNACNGEDVTGALWPAGSKPSCQGGFPNLRDMSGNAAEWEDSCVPQVPDPAYQACKLRGGGLHDKPENLACDSTSTSVGRGEEDDSIGFRCCWDP